ncbi:MAG: DinB family protein [Bacteroidota bacterium]
MHVNDSYATTFHQLLRHEARRRLFEESFPRLKKCLELLSEEQIWQRPNSELSSVGNLVLHLCGNIRQWLISGLGGAEDERNRASEFAHSVPISRANLINMLDALQEDAEETLSNIDLARLMKVVTIQGFRETGVSVLVHVIEHASYHVGQVTWYTKLVTEKDLGYYSGLDLSQKNPAT